DYDPSAILLYGWAFKGHLKVIRQLRRTIPIIFRGDSHLLDNLGVFASLKRRIFLSWIYRGIDIALYTGKNNLDYYKWCSVPQRKMIFGPHAIDNSRFECMH